MGRLFDTDNFLWRAFSKLADFFMTSLCFLVCCIPVITTGSAAIALYDTASRCVRGGEGRMYRRFFSTFKKELGRGILITLLWAALALVLGTGYEILIQKATDSNGWSAVSLIYLLSLFIPVGTVCWVVAVESRFVYRFGALHMTAFTFTFSYLPHTAAVTALLLVALYACYLFPPLVLVIPGALAYFQSFFMEKVFRRYMPEEE